MKYLSLLVIFSCLFLSSTYSQVKKQYIDAENSSTIVVVKEDNVSDLDILNANFNINDFGLGEVIMIKTEKEPTVAPKKEAKVVTAKVPTPKETPAKMVVKEVTKPARNVAAMPVARTKPSGGASAKSSSRSTSTKAKKYKKKKRAKRYKNRKFKKKRKNRRRVLCPSF